MVDVASLNESEGDSLDEDGNIFPDNEYAESSSSKRKIEHEGSSADVDAIGRQGINSASRKKRKVQKGNEVKKLHMPPTVDELNRLRETENLFHSNLFRRQIEEMLAELQINDKYKVRVNSWFDKFNDWLAKMEDDEEKHDISNSEWLKSLKIPVTAQKNIKGWYQFKKPLRAFLAGSYRTKTILGPGTIDIAIQVPNSFFQKEDNLNTRYHVKRAIYLNEVARHFQLMKDLVQDIYFVCDEGLNMMPALEIVPFGKLNKSTKFVIHFTTESMCFKKSRLAPSKNNVRPKWFHEHIKHECEETTLPPTPEYNCSILRDVRMAENDQFLSDVIGKSIQLRDAVVLLKVWLKQRELNVGLGGFSGFLVSMLIAYLLHIRKLNLTMSSYQIIRCVWNFLSSADWSKNGITLCEVNASNNQPPLSEFHDLYPLVFVDQSGFLNLCAGMTFSIFQRCKDECVKALHYLDVNDVDNFQILFMRNAPFSMLCDHTVFVHEWRKFDKIVDNHSSLSKKLDYCGTLYPQIRDIFAVLLERGVGQRAHRIYLKQCPRKCWPIGKKPPKNFSLTLGLILDPDHCFSRVDKGPVADAKEAQDFRDFWQGLSELRRFMDGSITEAVVWNAKTWEEKRLICRQIVNYLLKTKLGLGDEDFRYIADELHGALSRNSQAWSSKVLSQYEDLTKMLKALPELPLDIISVQGASPVFRHSDLNPPGLPSCSKKKQKDIKIKQLARKVISNSEAIDLESNKLPAWCAPAEVVIHLGSSNKWPHDLEAVRRIRAAFNINIAQVLWKDHHLLCQPYQDFTDVLTKTCVFRLRIVYPGEIVLMKRRQTAEGLTQYVDTEESLILEKKAVHLPKITSALRGVHNQHSSLGPACCLAKRWVRAHLFDEAHMSDEAIDLLMATVYINPEPWNPPHQPQVAFLRFLYLIGHTNWSLDFVLLNFNDELKTDDITSIRNFFDEHRSTLPPIFIATPYDTARSIWTREGPFPVVLLRLVNLCQLAHSLLTTQLYSKTALDYEPLFQPSLSVFDAVITLNNFYITRKQKSENAAAEGNLSHIPVVGFDPVSQYMDELKETYGEWALFFYDPYGGVAIGVVWKPASKEAKDVKVSHLYGRYLEEKTSQLYVNVNAMLEGFSTLGMKLVQKIEVKEDDQFVQFRT